MSQGGFKSGSISRASTENQFRAYDRLPPSGAGSPATGQL
jgi:hypothetical protein